MRHRRFLAILLILHVASVGVVGARTLAGPPIDTDDLRSSALSTAAIAPNTDLKALLELARLPGTPATMERIAKLAIPQCHSIDDFCALVTVFAREGQPEEVRSGTASKAALASVPTAKSVDEALKVLELLLPADVEKLAVEFTGTCKSAGDVAKLQSCVKDSATKAAILQRYLELQHPSLDLKQLVGTWSYTFTVSGIEAIESYTFWADGKTERAVRYSETGGYLILSGTYRKLQDNIIEFKYTEEHRVGETRSIDRVIQRKVTITGTTLELDRLDKSRPLVLQRR